MMTSSRGTRSTKTISAMETDRLTVQFLSENEKNRFEDSIDLAELESNINKISFKECQELAADIIINRVS